MTAITRSGKGESGFTLVELMLAITIFSILITIAHPIYLSAIVKAKEATLKRDLFIMRDVIDHYYSDAGEYPQALYDLVKNKYIRAIPVDPFTESNSTWVTLSSAPENFDVFDVHSGSDFVGRNGVPYNVW